MRYWHHSLQWGLALWECCSVSSSHYCVDVFTGVYVTSWLMYLRWVENLSDRQPLMEGLPCVAAAERHCWPTRWAGELEIRRAGVYLWACCWAIVAWPCIFLSKSLNSPELLCIFLWKDVTWNNYFFEKYLDICSWKILAMHAITVYAVFLYDSNVLCIKEDILTIVFPFDIGHGE